MVPQRSLGAGFVCFMNREDAEEAMEACNEADPFNVGRLLMMRWGKNVKKNVREGTGGGIAMKPLQRSEPETPAITSSVFEDPDEIFIREDGMPSMIQFNGPEEPVDISKAATFLPALHAESAIRVNLPKDKDRFHFISTIASFIAKDGSQLERKLMAQEGGNPQYSFLVMNSAKTEAQRDEHIFYRWRVYSFCQGDTFSNWRTEPFVMFHPNGRYWIPPPLDRLASSKERAESEEKKEKMRKEKDQRVENRGTEKVQGKKEFLTGRQIERARNNRRMGNRRNPNWDGGTTLSTADRDRFNFLVRKNLSISRQTICSAMAFCFEKSGAAHEISALLKETLMDDSPHITVDMRIARLYLMSDILFNSQQPGVRNAFMYRDALEKMAPEIFTSLGRHGSGQVGRMTMNKLRTAVSTVLGAWTEWSVYNPAFLDELEARFSGKEIKREEPQDNPSAEEINTATTETEKVVEEQAEVIIKQARGDWTEVAEDESDDEERSESDSSQSDGSNENRYNRDHQGPHQHVTMMHSSDGEILGHQDTKGGTNRFPTTGEEHGADDDEDLDGAPIDEEGNDIDVPNDGNVVNQSLDVHGKSFTDDDIDGDPVDEDMDGEPMDEDGIDGVPLEAESADVDGVALDDDDIDGEALDEEEVPKASEGEDLDGQPLEEDDDGEDLDGEALDEEEHTEIPNGFYQE